MGPGLVNLEDGRGEKQRGKQRGRLDVGCWTLLDVVGWVVEGEVFVGAVLCGNGKEEQSRERGTKRHKKGTTRKKELCLSVRVNNSQCVPNHSVGETLDLQTSIPISPSCSLLDDRLACWREACWQRLVSGNEHMSKHTIEKH